MKQNTIIIFYYLFTSDHSGRTQKSTRLSAGTHSPHPSLQPTVVYASADAASSSGAHTHAELLRLPSTSRRRDGARVVVVVGASVVVVLGACVVVVVVVGAFVVVVVVSAAVSTFVSVCFEDGVPDGPSSELVGPELTCATPFRFGLSGGAAVSFDPDNVTARTFEPGLAGPLTFGCNVRGLPLSSESECPPELLALSTTSDVTHTDGQQHRASTNRAHSRRHVIILVSVVVQWCGADLHSEGHGEQKGRREVRQTHTEGRPHEERAAARHAPYAAHHARHTLQSTAAGTHTHRWKREKQTGAAHKAPPHVHTARAVRRVGTPHGRYAHT
ncbi:hypothetical protein TCSYLVIO_007935 [Trypanosoma cruzi]|nr:hypothetical protein TCSYLVIO_007935 [Trypanosoma cruzi]